METIIEICSKTYRQLLKYCKTNEIDTNQLTFQDKNQQNQKLLIQQILQQNYQISKFDAKTYSEGYRVQLMTPIDPMKQLSYKQWRNEIEHWKPIPSVLKHGKIYYIATPGKIKIKQNHVK
jgi:hypothetical protein